MWRERLGVRRILTVRLDNIGDVVLTSAAHRALKEAFPESEITLLASPAGSEAAVLVPWIDDVMVVRSLWQDVGGGLPFDPGRERALIDSLADRAFDAAIVFTSFKQSPFPAAYAAYLAGIPLRAGASREFGGAVLSHAVEPSAFETHEAERNLDLLRGIGLRVEDAATELRLPLGILGRAEDVLRDVGVDIHRPYAVIAPGAGAAARTYPAERFARVASGIAAATGMQVLALGRAKERDAEAAMVASGDDRVVPLFEDLGVPMLAALIARASLVVGNDSGPMHIADAFGVPVVATFSGTELESQFAPRRSPTRLLRVATSCAPCYRFECPSGLPCLDIPPDEVVRAALDVLAEDPPTTTQGETWHRTSRRNGRFAS